MRKTPLELHKKPWTRKYSRVAEALKQQLLSPEDNGFITYLSPSLCASIRNLTSIKLDAEYVPGPDLMEVVWYEDGIAAGAEIIAVAPLRLPRRKLGAD
ncbi:hypothetical protein NDU88_004553 [Pleurodeles waltl]|uniref:Uncharacterized protein n=1 Tax=Pleurodeles waltl TaxID=8319 RepID=A0AAV7MTS9_PLEWA|nr:hypothetical protein NDU88_004553 [Pleurodeles waltl]